MLPDSVLLSVIETKFAKLKAVHVGLLLGQPEQSFFVGYLDSLHKALPRGSSDVPRKDLRLGRKAKNAYYISFRLIIQYQRHIWTPGLQEFQEDRIGIYHTRGLWLAQVPQQGMLNPSG